MAAGKKNAARLKATIGFLDESGLLLAPLVRRTWAPRGQTPILRQRTSSRDKVSMIATLMVSPRRRRVRLDTALMVNANVDAECLVEYLRALLRHLRGPLILIWDRLNVHRAALIKALLRRHPRLRTELLPPYAPELNPVEQLWQHLKWNCLANFAPRDVLQLAGVARRRPAHIRRNPNRLRAFDLPFD